MQMKDAKGSPSGNVDLERVRYWKESLDAVYRYLESTRGKPEHLLARALYIEMQDLVESSLPPEMEHYLYRC